MVQRFKAALTDGYWSDNPEDLVRDESGDYVTYDDYKKLEETLAKLHDAAKNEIYYVAIHHESETDAVERLDNILEREMK